LGVANCVEALERKVTDSMNEKLLADFTVEEISLALQQMPPLKAPRPDDSSACFHQQNWATMHYEVCDAILHYFNTGLMDTSINITHIALIPKVSSSGCVMEFCLTSLCNVIYKLISKVLANRLKLVLPMIISPFQSAFIPGRLITDNILVAFETIHSIQTMMWSKVCFMAIKHDMSKAYDRVEWPFLEAVLIHLGFAKRWVNLVMTCIGTISYSVVVNGNPVGQIQPSRGIK
jgi:hypothetical protein